MLRRQKHALSQSTTPFACTLWREITKSHPDSWVLSYCDFSDFQDLVRVPHKSSSASGSSLHGGASFKVEKANFAAWKKGPESCKNEVRLPPPLCAAP